MPQAIGQPASEAEYARRRRCESCRRSYRNFTSSAAFESWRSSSRASSRAMSSSSRFVRGHVQQRYTLAIPAAFFGSTIPGVIHRSQLGHATRLAYKAIEILAGGQITGARHLDGNLPLQLRIVSFVDGSKGTVPDDGDEFKASSQFLPRARLQAAVRACFAGRKLDPQEEQRISFWEANWINSRGL